MPVMPKAVNFQDSTSHRGGSPPFTAGGCLDQPEASVEKPHLPLYFHSMIPEQKPQTLRFLWRRDIVKARRQSFLTTSVLQRFGAELGLQPSWNLQFPGRVSVLGHRSPCLSVYDDPWLLSFGPALCDKTYLSHVKYNDEFCRSGLQSLELSCGMSAISKVPGIAFRRSDPSAQSGFSTLRLSDSCSISGVPPVRGFGMSGW